MTKIICGFPGIGKTYLTQNNQYPQYHFLDLDSSQFDKSGFPENYLAAIDRHFVEGVYDFILVSTHPDVIKCIDDRNYGYGVVHVVYPEYKRDPRHQIYADRENERLKEMFMNRYISRGSSPEFIKLMDTNFWNFVEDLENAPVGLTQHRCNSTLDDLNFYVWRILGLTNGIEKNLVSNWDGWDEDGHTLVFHDAVLNPNGWGPHYYSMMHQHKSTNKFEVFIDTEHGFVTVDDREFDQSYNYTFEISLKRFKN